MSSNATADVPDASAGTGPAAPTDVADVAQVGQLAEQASEQAVDALRAEPVVAPASDREPGAPTELTDDTNDASPAADSAPGEPAGESERTDDAAGAADDSEQARTVDEDEPDEHEPADEPAEDYEAAQEYGPAEDYEAAQEYGPAEDYEAAELLDEPIEMAEPVEFAEPVEENEPRRRHGVLLTSGVVLGVVAIIGGAIAIVGSFTHGFSKAPEVTYTKSAVFSLRAGQCIDSQGQSVSILSCGTPHDAEVFATFTLPASKWPGDTAVQAAASSGCATRLNGYINPQLSISLASTYVYPDSVAWQAGTRTVICEVKATTGQLIGSVRSATATATATAAAS